jgi:hypothetical protein
MGMFEQARRGSQDSSIGHDTGAGVPGKRTLSESQSSGTRDGRGVMSHDGRDATRDTRSATPTSLEDARGGAAKGGGAVVDDRGTGALIGGGIGAVGGAIIGGLVGGVPGAIGGAVLGGALGAGVGGALGGGTTVPAPVAVRNGPTHAPIDSGDDVGMSIAITITSSTGVDADMARIQDSEHVGLSFNHTGSCASLPALASNQSGFMAGFPIPDDQHGWSRAAVIDRADNHGGNGSFEKHQLDVFTDAAASVTAPTVIPHSGYIIKRIITKGPGTLITFRTEKRPAAVTVNGFSTAAGPSAQQSDSVVIRP